MSRHDKRATNQDGQKGRTKISKGTSRRIGMQKRVTHKHMLHEAQFHDHGMDHWHVAHAYALVHALRANGKVNSLGSIPRLSMPW
jgi:hypothetical protein